MAKVWIFFFTCSHMCVCAYTHTIKTYFLTIFALICYTDIHVISANHDVCFIIICKSIRATTQIQISNYEESTEQSNFLLKFDCSVLSGYYAHLKFILKHFSKTNYFIEVAL